jgi:hypothetical protein
MDGPMNLPAVFLLDAQTQLQACIDIMPVMSNMRCQVASQLMLQIVMHLLLDAREPPRYPDYVGTLTNLDASVVTDPNEGRAHRLCTTVNTFASQDIGQYKYAFTEEVMLNLYQWYFETYLVVLGELNHFFPGYQLKEDGLPYTVKLYDTLLRFDHIPQSRNWNYVMDRAF